MARALYIHWPFCLRKCPYCDFNSHVRDEVDHARWQAALLADMCAEAELAGGEPLESVFFGGGTPSLMPPSLVGALLDKAQDLWGFAPYIEITLEANPSSVEASKFADLALAGVNRTSLGLQALDDAKLRFLGRLHDTQEGLKALEVAQKAFKRVSFDLIYALPGHTPEEWEHELRRALSFGTSHLSLYQLTIEEGTRFATMVRQGKFAPLDDDGAADLYDLTQQLTIEAGIPAYEISNHAKPGEESRHNLTYWCYRDYVGIGPGAHGRRGGFATQRHRKPENWLAAVEARGSGYQSEIAIPIEEQASEALLMGLRLREGIDLAAMATRFDMESSKLIDFEALNQLQKLGFVAQQAEHISITAKGMPLLDAILPRIVHDGLVSA